MARGDSDSAAEDSRVSFRSDYVESVGSRLRRANVEPDWTVMDDTKTTLYEIEHFYPGFDRQKFWDLFVDNEGWSRSDILPGQISIIKPGRGHPQGAGGVRAVSSGSMNIIEDVVGFQPPEYFSYASRNGSMPVNEFGGTLFLEQRDDGLLARYRGGFNPKYFGTGWLFRRIFRAAQKSAFRGLGRAYTARYGA